MDQTHPDYHEGFQHGITANVDDLRCGYETTPEYCAGYDAGHDFRNALQAKGEEGSRNG